MIEPLNQPVRRSSPYGNSNRNSNGSSRTNPYRTTPQEYYDAEPEFLYPQEIEEPLEAAPAFERRRPLDIPPVEPSSKTRRPRTTRPMPRRLSEEFIPEIPEEEPEEEAPVEQKPKGRKRTTKAAAETGEQIELKLKTPAKKPDTNVKKRQSLGVILVVMAVFILLAIISYSAQDAAQAETHITDLPAIFLRSDPVVNANADTVHNWVGLVGAMIANFFINKTIGYAAVIFPFFMAWWSLALFRFSTKQRRRLTLATSFMLISAILFSATIGTTQLIAALPHLDREWSGAVGQFLGLTFTRLIGSIGALIIYATSFVVMLVFAIDLDIEVTFKRLQGGYSGLAAKTRMRLIEFWDKREEKRAEKLERKAQNHTAEEIHDSILKHEAPVVDTIEEDEAEIVVKKPQPVVKETPTPVRMTPPVSQQVEEVAADESDFLNPARDIITIRQNGASAKKEEVPFLKVRPAPKATNGIAPKPITRISRQNDGVLGEKAAAMNRLSNGAAGATAARGVRILPTDITEENSIPIVNLKQRPDVPIVEPVVEIPKPAVISSAKIIELPEPVIEETPGVEIGDEKVLSNEALPHSVSVEEVAAEIVPVIPAEKKIMPATLFGSSDIIAENPYNEHLTRYRHPSLDLLTPTAAADEMEADNEELEAKGRVLRDKLAQFGVEIENIVVTPGPVVTLYEFVPAEGVKVSTVGNLTDDIALAMKARGIRIIAPMPGRGTIGIEIPNDHPKMVRMRQVLESPAFTNSKMNLPLALGKTISGDVYIDDLSKMPHLLIAGATGAGKSVGVNGILASLLYSKSPRDVKFVIVDPKKIELSLYKALKDHFLIVSPEVGEEIVTTPAYAVLALQACVIEMERRYDKLAKAAVRSLADYNLKVSQGKLKSTQSEQHYHLPYLVVIIDELADLMITAGRDIEEPICRLAQMARAVGIHLILATQRPSVDVITGVIKANFPARIAYQVA
ncbi:MAG TPA: DNA translocase FtsK 4TM domain-containing protein, partial [Candidatus Kapabacteria bacterium]|nr:DNA translocase FtsK 4TM domain-containing protein [Candidatus Kapabacteria bacterium]